MSSIKEILVGALVLCVGVITGVLIGNSQVPAVDELGGLYNTNPTQFINGFSAGTSGQFAVSSTGATTVTNVTATGESHLFGDAASSTVQIGAASKAGCLVIGDSADGAAPVYITATGATITATTTKPAACQTAQ